MHAENDHATDSKTREFRWLNTQRRIDKWKKKQHLSSAAINGTFLELSHPLWKGVFESMIFRFPKGGIC